MEKQTGIKKRQRSENWLNEDKHLLTQLIREKVSIIENKNTDTSTNTKKKSAWEDILKNFNKTCKGGNRTVPQLKSQWAIIKMIRKKEKSSGQKQISVPGEGSSLQKDSESGDDICSWLPNELVLVNDSFDFDSRIQVKVEDQYDDSDSKIVETQNQEDEVIQEVKVEDQSEENDLEIVEHENHDVDIMEKIASTTGVEELDEEKGNENKVSPSARGRKRKIRKEFKEKYESKTSSYAANIANFEIKCRKDLHQLQMENEKRKARNLDLEEMLIRKKIEFYEKKLKTF